MEPEKAGVILREVEIGRIILALHAAWLRHPELRLGQLVDSAAAVWQSERNIAHPTTFFIEDADLIASVQKMVAKW